MELFDKNLWRGPHPELDDLHSLELAGVKKSIDLQPNYSEIREETINAQAFDIKVFPFPLCPVFWPDYIDVNFLVQYLLENDNIFIHCKAGVDRTGYVVAAYRVIVNGWTVEAAVEEMKAKGMHWWLRWWIPRFRRDIEKLKLELH